MTNEQIQQLCDGLVKLVRVAQVQGTDPARLYEEFAYRLLYAAYEEAAQAAEINSSEAAQSIRTLKDALAADFTVQTRSL